jgi:hypothetical protein
MFMKKIVEVSLTYYELCSAVAGKSVLIVGKMSGFTLVQLWALNTSVTTIF